MSSLCILATLSFVSGEPKNRFPENQCGPACLYFVSKWFGQAHKLADLSQSCHSSSGSGTSLAKLEQAARNLGWYPILIELPTSDLAKIPEPAIVFLSKKNAAIGHFVVHWGQGDRVRILDPTGSIWDGEAPRDTSKTVPVMIVCEAWTDALACHLRLLYYRSPLRAIAVAVACTLGIVFTILTIANCLAKATRRRLTLSHLVILFTSVTVLLGCGSGTQGEIANEVIGPDRKLVSVGGSHYTGTLRKGEQTRHVFSFRNQSDHVINLVNVQSSCTCLSARLLGSKSLLPGQQGDVEATLTGNFNGGKSAQILLIGDQRQVLLSFFVHLNVLLEWCTDRDIVRLNEVPQNATRTTLVRVHLDDMTDPQVAANKLRVGALPHGTAVEVVTPSPNAAERNSSLLLRVTLNSGIRLNNGREQSFLLMIPDSTGFEHTVPVRLAWTYRVKATSYPPEVVIVVEKGKVIGSTELSVDSDLDITVNRVTAVNGVLDADVTQLQASENKRVYRSRLQFVGDVGTAAFTKGFINYYSDAEADPLLKVPFRLRVVP